MKNLQEDIKIYSLRKKNYKKSIISDVIGLLALLSGVKNEYLWLFSRRKNKTSESTMTRTTCILPLPCIKVATPSNLQQVHRQLFSIFVSINRNDRQILNHECSIIVISYTTTVPC